MMLPGKAYPVCRDSECRFKTTHAHVENKAVVINMEAEIELIEAKLRALRRQFGLPGRRIGAEPVTPRPIDIFERRIPRPADEILDPDLLHS